MEIKAINLSKTYDGAYYALNDVNFEINGQGLYLVTGDNGSGKTTLFNIIAGLDNATSGSILINGVDIGTMKGSSLTKFRRDSVSFIFQDINLISNISVYDNLVLATGKNDSEKILRYLNLVGMEEYKDKIVNELSGGQQQRVAIARAFVRSSDIVLADELTASLDKETSQIVVQLLKKLSMEKCVLVITHNRELFEGLYDGEINLDRGRNTQNILKSNQKSVKQDRQRTGNSLSYKTLFKYACSNLNKNLSKKLYFLVFSVILLTTILVSVSSMYNEYLDITDSFIEDCEYEYVNCITEANNLKDVVYMYDNNYTAALYLNNDVQSCKELFWMPMWYGRSEKVVEVTDTFIDNAKIIGRFPSAIHEIAITDYTADFLLSLKKEYTNREDLIDEEEIIVTYLKQSFTLKVTGIIQTDYNQYADLYQIQQVDLTYAIGDEYRTSGLRWNMNKLLESSKTSLDKAYYLYLAQAMSNYNVYYVCNNFERENFYNFQALNLSDSDAVEHNLPAFYSISNVSQLELPKIYLQNKNSGGVVAPLSQLISAEKVNDLFALYQDMELVYKDIAAMTFENITIEVEESVLKTLESMSSDSIVYKQTYPIVGFYDDYQTEGKMKTFYLADEDFNEVLTQFANYIPSSISAYINFSAMSDDKRYEVVKGILGDNVPNANMVFPEKQIIDKAYIELKTIQAVFIVLFILMMALSTIFLCRIIVEDIKDNEKNYAILKSLGVSNLQLILTSLIVPVAVLILGICISLILGAISIAILNAWVMNGFFSIAIIKMKLAGVAAVFILCVLSILIGAIIGLRRLITQPPIKSLKTN